MRLILNEQYLLDKSLTEGYINNKPSVTIRILAKHYLSIGMDANQTYDAIDTFLNKHYTEYIPMNWYKLIKGIINRLIKNKDYSLVHIENVKITKKEINKIKTINDIKLEKLAFTLLVYAKIYNQLNNNNSNWVNEQHKYIFEDAKIPVTKIKQGKMIYQLKELNFVTVPLKVDRVNIKVNFVDDDYSKDNIAIIIDDFRNFVYEYQMYFNYNKYIRCSECGKLIKPKSNRQKFCRSCWKEKQLEWQRESMRKSRSK